jgi:hypothetical protein
MISSVKIDIISAGWPAEQPTTTLEYDINSSGWMVVEASSDNWP